MVLDINGVHNITLHFCECQTAQSRTTQLLRMRWFPATTLDPKTTATFRLLHHFHVLSFESKASTFEYWQTLARLTNNTGVNPPKVSFQFGLTCSFIIAHNGSQDRYNALLRMVKEWRNLTLLKRSGRGHDPGGVAATQHGACAVLCPACPHPGKNLPNGWEDTPFEERYVMDWSSPCSVFTHRMI